MHRTLLSTKSDSERRVVLLLRYHEFGLRCTEISRMLGMEYWKVRECVHKLNKDNQIHNEGAFWFAD